MKDLELPGSYLLEPLAEAGKTIYVLSELGPKALKSPFAKTANFCLLPYQHPLRGKIKPLFYRKHSGHEIKIMGERAGQDGGISLRPSLSRNEYLEKLRMLKAEIQQGNIYEINYCIEFVAEDVAIDPLNVFRKLYSRTKAPYSSLVKLGDEFIISASPELFLKKEGRMLFTKPIKGTARRGRTAEEDEQLKQELHRSVKERTENVMAVDVARNDLSRIAERGSVKVNRLYNIETYETVHHMVSTVSCTIRDNVGFDEIMEATFPMASMTGAPKVSAMNLIDASESFKRHFYSGAMGTVEANGDFGLSVNIRCIFYNQRSKRLSIAVGSAITHLCEPEREYEECLLKARALMEALNAKPD